MTASAEMLRPLQGRVALVAGASSGIGRAVAGRLGQAGARLVLVARRAERLERVADELGGLAVAADLSLPADVESVAAAVHDGFGGAPDVLVNAAGAFALAPLSGTSVELFDAQIAANLRAPFLLIRAFLGELLERGSGHVVTIGSVAGRVALPHNGAYAASKYGVRGLHEVLELELRGTGVRATLIEPGATDTPLWDAIDRSALPGLPEPASMLEAAQVAEAVYYAVTRPASVAVSTVRIQRS